MWLKDRQLRLRISRSVCAGLLLAWPGSACAQAITATISVGAAPEAVAINTVTNKIYVANYLSANVTVIDGTTNSTATVQTALHPVAVAVNEATNKIYVANQGFGGPFGNGDTGSVTVIDGVTNLTTTVMDPNADGPRAVAVNPVTNKIYVANFWTGNVTVIDGATNSTVTVADPNAHGLAACALAVNPSTNKIYVANNNLTGVSTTNPGNVTVIDGSNNSATTLSDPNAFSPFAVAVNTATNKVYVANEGDAGSNHGNVTVIDGGTNSITTFTDSNALGPVDIAVNRIANKIYVADITDSAATRNGGVTVIDGATNSLSFVSAGPNSHIPHAVALNSVTNTIFVSSEGCFQEDPCRNPGSVTAINGVTKAVTTVINPSAHNPEGIAVNEVNNKIYVANGGGNNVTVIDGGAIPTTHTLSVVLEGSGSGTVTSNPTGINCGTSCATSFTPGTTVNLVASPASGSQFAGWTTNCTGMGSCNVTLTTSDEFVTATFSTLAPDFSITAASASLTAQRGVQVTDVITIAPQNGPFGSAVELSCAVAGSTPLATCGLSPNAVTPGANSPTSALTVIAPTQSAQLTPSNEGKLLSSLYAVFFPIPLALIGLSMSSGKSRNWTRNLWLLCSLFAAIVDFQAGCGGGSTNQTTNQFPLNYTVTVTATSGAIQHTTQVTVTVP